jgi:hypothetical protein
VKTAQARVDLGHITAAILIFEAGGDRTAWPYMQAQMGVLQMAGNGTALGVELPPARHVSLNCLSLTRLNREATMSWPIGQGRGDGYASGSARRRRARCGCSIPIRFKSSSESDARISINSPPDLS